MPSVDAQQLRALVGAVHRPDDARTAVAVRAEPEWRGPDTLDGDRPVRVVGCASPLAVRAALVEHEHRGAGEVLAILTSCSDGDLGPDVLARLAKGRVLSIDPYAALLGLFRASVLDPVLTRDDRWLIDELISLAPPGGWPDERLIGGVLDNDSAWKVWHAERLGLHAVPETLADVLRLADQPGLEGRLAALAPEQRTRLGTRWAGGAAPASVLIDVIAAGRGADLIPLGCVAGVLWAATDDPVLAQLQTIGRVRLESLLGRNALDDRSARAWEHAAREVLKNSGAMQAWLDRAEHLLAEASVTALAVLSDDLTTGFDERLGRLAASLEARDIRAAEDACGALARHRLGGRRTRRLAAAQAAVRLLRRSTEPLSPPRSFAEHVNAYADDGAWVDEARRILSEGEASPTLSMAYASLCATVDEQQRSTDLAFARLLAEWSKSEPIPHDEIVPVEHVLDVVVSPIARELPVLVLVCDGMGLAVAHELLRDLAEEGWTPAMPMGRERWPVGVAMLPTITEISRTSLLSGARSEGGQADERAGFTAHAGLRAASAGQKSPILFHKAQLVGPTGQALPNDVRSAVSDPTQRVVGVVVNAVDDHLSRGQQVRVGWGLESLGPLQWLLEASIEAGRVIVLTADHGHVLHGEGAALRSVGEAGGERWRGTPPPVTDDEVEVTGPRVGKGGSAVLAVDERIHYAGHKHGYHGGASLQEVLVPVVALARVLPDGWVRRPLTPPPWWTGDIAPDPLPPVEPTKSISTVKKKPDDQPSLFGNDPRETAGVGRAATWVDELLTSPLFTAHQERVRLPRQISTDRLRGYLSAIHSSGGTIELSALAARIGEPADQLRMALSLVQRLLNVDGSEILAVRNNSTVEMNAELIRVQFEVDVR